MRCAICARPARWAKSSAATFAADGSPIATSLHDRLIALPNGMQLRGLVGVAGGEDKHDAINAVLQSSLLSGLITDEPTARRLVAATAMTRGTGRDETHA